MTQAEIQALIDNAEEESLILDYKASAALARSDGKKKEVTKDVSAMANAAGGRIVYGVKEFDDPARRHLPERIDPVDRQEFTKEWLEHVISSIRPRIPGLLIHVVSLESGPNDVVYVVDIPQGETAHQAADLRYYRRYNFESVPMYDHEIRDVMGRQQHPRLELEFHIEISTFEYQSNPLLPGGGQRREETEYNLRVAAINDGNRFAQYVNGWVSVPVHLLREFDPRDADERTIDGVRYERFNFDNTRRDVVGTDKNPLGPRPIYGPSWFDPILPGLTRVLETIELDAERLEASADAQLLWSVYADNAPPTQGATAFASVRIIDQR